MSNYKELISKLDGFIRKFYLNKLIRGSLLFVGLILFLFMLFSFLEYNFYFERSVRKIFFFGFIGLAAISSYFWLLRPALHYFKLGQIIDHSQAANIVGEHFGNVKDKLLNILQLKNQMTSSPDDSLLLAGIEQKTVELKPVSFKNAVDLTRNKQYLKYALPPTLLFLGLIFAAPSILSEGSKRIINNNKDFERPAPFNFKLNNTSNLKAIQFEDYKISVRTQGDVIPSQSYIHIGNQTFQMENSTNSDFTFTLKNLSEDVEFHFSSGEVESKSYKVKVLKKPQIEDMVIKAYYPKYIGRPSESFYNVGDLTVPHGTQLNWKIKGKETSELIFSDPVKGKLPFEKIDANNYKFKKGIYSPLQYNLISSSLDLPNSDSISYTIDVVPDRHPTITVETIADNAESKIKLFAGKAGDDYGISKINFVYKVQSELGGYSEDKIISLKGKTGIYSSFEYLFDLDSFNLNPGDNISYYFEVWDNDGVRGSKSAKTALYSFKKESIEKIEETTKENSDDIEKLLKENLEKTKDLKKEMQKIQENFLNKKELNWQDKKELEKLMEKHSEIKNDMQKAKQKFQENKENKKKFQELSEKLQKKQEKIEEMFDKVIDEELKELMEEIQKMMEELNRDKSLEELNEMEFNNEDLEMELEKMEELFKQLEVETEMEKHIEKLKELAKEQEKLSEETKEEEKTKEELKEEQEKLNEEFKELKEEIKETKEKNEELEKPKNIEDTKEEEEEIEKEQEKSSDDLEKDKKQDASKSQKGASKKMEEMADKMMEGMQGGEQEQMGEDLKLVRQLLENILTLSFEEEDLINYLKKANIHTPYYISLVQNQFKIQDDFELVRDSLHEMSKRVSQLESFLIEKASDISKDLEKSVNQLEERKKSQAVVPQRTVMKNLNDLALMLSESMQQMQQQMSGMMSGNQMCNNPKPGGKGGKKPMDKISEGQSGMKESLQKMKDKLKNGKQNGSAQEFAEMAAKQAALRKMLGDVAKEQSERGENSELLQEIMKAMDEVEKDLVNKQLSNETMNRQQDIMTRLLKAEKAEREREYEEKREAETGKQVDRKIPPIIEAYLKKRASQLKEIDRSSPGLNPYYKELVELYYKALSNQ